MSAVTATGFTLSVSKSGGGRRSPRFAIRWLDAETAVITVAGEIDAATANMLCASCSGVLSRARRMVLDLGDLEFIGVECLSELERLDAECRAAGVRWVLVAGAAAARLLRLRVADTGLTTTGTVEAAVNRVGGTGRALALVRGGSC